MHFFLNNLLRLELMTWNKALTIFARSNNLHFKSPVFLSYDFVMYIIIY